MTFMDKHFWIRDFAKEHKKTEDDIKAYIYWDHAQYLNDLSVLELYQELSERYGKIEVQTIDDLDDYLNDLGDEDLKVVTDRIAYFWEHGYLDDGPQ